MRILNAFWELSLILLVICAGLMFLWLPDVFWYGISSDGPQPLPGEPYDVWKSVWQQMRR